MCLTENTELHLDDKGGALALRATFTLGSPQRDPRPTPSEGPLNLGHHALTQKTYTAFLGAQTKGDKIRSGYQKRNEDCPGFLNSTGRLGPKRGQKCYATPAFSRVPKQRGTKSEVAASTLPSRRP